MSGEECPDAVERADLDTERLLPPEDPEHHVGDGVGHERRGQGRLSVAPPAVADHDLRRAHGGGGVGQVVGHHLVGVDGAGAGRAKMSGDAVHDALGGFEGQGGGVQIGSRPGPFGHPRRLPAAERVQSCDKIVSWERR